MKPNISEHLARIAITAAAVICGTAFFTASAVAQDGAANCRDSNNNVSCNLVYDGGNEIRLTESNSRQWDVLSFPSLTGNYPPPVIKIGNPRRDSAGRESYNITGVPGTDFNFSRPFWGFRAFDRPNAFALFPFSNRLRVAGIKRGRIVVERFVVFNVPTPLYFPNLAGVQNVLGKEPGSHELTYQWQTRAAEGSGSWTNRSTSLNYSNNDGLTSPAGQHLLRVIATDRAGFHAPMTVLAQGRGTALAPQGNLVIRTTEGTTDGRTPYSRNQTYTGALNIDNGVTGGVLTYQFEVAKADKVLYAGQYDNANAVAAVEPVNIRPGVRLYSLTGGLC